MKFRVVDAVRKKTESADIDKQKSNQRGCKKGQHKFCPTGWECQRYKNLKGEQGTTPR